MCYWRIISVDKKNFLFFVFMLELGRLSPRLWETKRKNKTVALSSANQGRGAEVTGSDPGPLKSQPGT